MRLLTLTELAVTIAVIGTLAALAVPLYRDYSIRSAVSEILLAVTDSQADIAQTCRSGCTAVSVRRASSKFIADAAVFAGGGIRVEGDAEKIGAAVSLTLTPSWTGTGVDWSCVGQPVKYMPASCR